MQTHAHDVKQFFFLGLVAILFLLLELKSYSSVLIMENVDNILFFLLKSIGNVDKTWFFWKNNRQSHTVYYAV